MVLIYFLLLTLIWSSQVLCTRASKYTNELTNISCDFNHGMCGYTASSDCILFKQFRTKENVVLLWKHINDLPDLQRNVRRCSGNMRSPVIKPGDFQLKFHYWQMSETSKLHVVAQYIDNNNENGEDFIWQSDSGIQLGKKVSITFKQNTSFRIIFRTETYNIQRHQILAIDDIQLFSIQPHVNDNNINTLTNKKNPSLLDRLLARFRRGSITKQPFNLSTTRSSNSLNTKHVTVNNDLTVQTVEATDHPDVSTKSPSHSDPSSTQSTSVLTRFLTKQSKQITTTGLSITRSTTSGYSTTPSTSVTTRDHLTTQPKSFSTSDHSAIQSVPISGHSSESKTTIPSHSTTQWMSTTTSSHPTTKLITVTTSGQPKKQLTPIKTPSKPKNQSTSIPVHDYSTTKSTTVSSRHSKTRSTFVATSDHQTTKSSLVTTPWHSATKLTPVTTSGYSTTKSTSITTPGHSTKQSMPFTTSGQPTTQSTPMITQDQVTAKSTLMTTLGHPTTQSTTVSTQGYKTTRSMSVTPLRFSTAQSTSVTRLDHPTTKSTTTSQENSTIKPTIISTRGHSTKQWTLFKTPGRSTTKSTTLIPTGHSKTKSTLFTKPGHSPLQSMTATQSGHSITQSMSVTATSYSMKQSTTVTTPGHSTRRLTTVTKAGDSNTKSTIPTLHVGHSTKQSPKVTTLRQSTILLTRITTSTQLKMQSTLVTTQGRPKTQLTSVPKQMFSTVHSTKIPIRGNFTTPIPTQRDLSTQSIRSSTYIRRQSELTSTANTKNVNLITTGTTTMKQFTASTRKLTATPVYNTENFSKPLKLGTISTTTGQSVTNTSPLIHTTNGTYINKTLEGTVPQSYATTALEDGAIVGVLGVVVIFVLFAGVFLYSEWKEKHKFDTTKSHQEKNHSEAILLNMSELHVKTSEEFRMNEKPTADTEEVTLNDT